MYVAALRPQVANTTALDSLEGRIRRGSGAQEIPFEEAVGTSYGEVADFTSREGESLGRGIIGPQQLLHCEDVMLNNYNALRERIPIMGQEAQC